MTIETVLVSGEIYNPDGSFAVDTPVRFTLSGLGIVGLSLVVPRYADTVTDAMGKFALQVVPSPAGTYYSVRASRNGALLFAAQAVVPATACQLTQIMQALPVPSLMAAEQALIDLQAAQGEIEANRLSAEESAAIALAAVDAPGRAGPQGEKGDTGSAGPQGAQGDTGAAGEKGADSMVQGPQGPAGTTGDTGPAGVAGAQGAQGIQGVAGAAGAKGDVGDVNPQMPVILAAAEAARDAALATGKIYTTTAAGLAATTTTQYFSVPSPESAEFLILYLNNAGAAVEQKRYASSTGLSAVGGASVSAINAVFAGVRNLFDATRVTPAMTLQNGVTTSQTATFVTGYFPVEPGDSFITNVAIKGGGGYGGVSFYDYKKGVISSNPVAISAGTAVAVPANVMWARFAVDNTAITTSMMIVHGSGLPAKYLTNEFLDKQAAKDLSLDQCAESLGAFNIFDKSAIQDSFYLHSGNDGLTANASYYVTPYMSVAQGGTVTFNGTSSLASGYGLTWYDLKKQRIVSAAGQGTSVVAGTAYTVPFGAAYLRTTMDKAGNPASGLVVVRGSVLPAFYAPFGPQGVIAHLKPWEGAGMAFLGDSITADSGPLHWPRVLAKEIHATVTANWATSGRVMRDLVKTTGGVALTAADFATTDLVVMFAGTNDYNAARVGGTGWLLGSMSDAASYGANSFFANTKYVVETLLGFKPTMRVILFTPIYRATSPSATTPTAEGKILRDYADAIVTIGKYYACPVLDLLAVNGLHAFNQSVYLSDGLHPTGPGGLTVIGKPAAAFFDAIR